jgi:hypothetical protein
MSLKIVTCLILLALSALTAGQVEEVDTKAAAELRARIEESPKLPFAGVAFAAKPPTIGWESGAVSWVAVDGRGNIYEIQRGDKADPVLVLDTEGKILRSWGKGDYKIPHSIRIAQGRRRMPLAIRIAADNRATVKCIKRLGGPWQIYESGFASPAVAGGINHFQIATIQSGRVSLGPFHVEHDFKRLAIAGSIDKRLLIPIRKLPYPRGKRLECRRIRNLNRLIETTSRNNNEIDRAFAVSK